MKRILLATALAIFGMGIPANAQFLQKLGSAVKKARQVTDAVSGTTQQDTQQQGTQQQGTTISSFDALRGKSQTQQADTQSQQSGTQTQATTQTESAGPFTVTPPPFQKFITLTTTGVNLRQRPTTSSARLVWEENEMGDLMLTWTTSSRNSSIQSPVDPTVLAVVGESGDWYQVIVDDYFGAQKAWIMKKFCNDATTRMLKASETSFKLITSGPYANYFFGDEETEGGFKLYIGKIIEGYWVAARTCFYNCDETAATTTIENGYITFGRKYKGNNNSADLNKVISDATMLKRIMDSCSTFDPCAIYYYGLTGKTGVYTSTVVNE